MSFSSLHRGGGGRPSRGFRAKNKNLVRPCVRLEKQSSGGATVVSSETHKMFLEGSPTNQMPIQGKKARGHEHRGKDETRHWGGSNSLPLAELPRSNPEKSIRGSLQKGLFKRVLLWVRLWGSVATIAGKRLSPPKPAKEKGIGGAEAPGGVNHLRKKKLDGSRTKASSLKEESSNRKSEK